MLVRASRFAAYTFCTLCAALIADCARAQCQLNSDCVPRGTCVMNACVSDCAEDRDCPASAPSCDINGRCVAPPDAGPGVDSGTDAHDAGQDTRDVPMAADVRDTVTPPPDNGPPPDNFVPPDIFVPPDVQQPDVQMGGAGRYLDNCTSNTDCASGICNMAMPRFCSIACTSNNDCADGQICGGGHCQLDDTGTVGCNPSNPAAGVACIAACFGTPTLAQCTHQCVNAADCPSGFACSPVSGNKVCVDIEIPCNTANDCPSGLGYCGAGMDGCTARCGSATDCPIRLSELASLPYTCDFNASAGYSVCTVPADVMGSDPIGATCAATGTNTCRSGACDTDTTPPICAQRCTPRGGCPPGFGCFPDQSGGTTDLVCFPAGRGWLGSTCAHASECHTSICVPQPANPTEGYCTRLCNDGLCPTGMHCADQHVISSDGTEIMWCEM